MFSRLIVGALVLGLCACNTLSPDRLSAPGVSRELAQYRQEHYREVVYHLQFSVPQQRNQPVQGKAEIVLTLEKPSPLIADFRGDSSAVEYVRLNGQPVPYVFRDEHISIDARETVSGENRLEVGFTPLDQSLNRRDDFLYTLLVPDRARTLFPCFDQPDLKSRFVLTLEVPDTWTAVANGAVSEIDSTSMAGKRRVSFRETAPIPTYLFSFVCGRFSKYTEQRDGRSVSMYHRETDPRKVAQCPAVLDQVFHALEWVEEYTGIPYPFEKYDLIVIPGFQYGGMEHMGATLYADRSIFLEDNATIDNYMGRAGLIAHETAHMWFGDFVTMKWFDEVWTKEVFATFFSSMIVRPMFPQVDHDLNFIKGSYPAAYSEDRTDGSMPIQQPLDNLSDAGLIYSQIVYSKSPIVMNMLYRKLGPEKFREGIREYLGKYAYGNATWNDLIAILDSRCDEDLAAWSRVWVEEKGMPTVHCSIQADSLRVRQEDPWKRGLVWEQPLSCLAIGRQGIDTVRVEMNRAEVSVKLPDSTLYVLPNADGLAYGYFPLDDATSGYLMTHLADFSDPRVRLSALLTLNENLLNLTLSPSDFLQAMIDYMPREENHQLFTLALGYASGCFGLFYGELPSPEFEVALWRMAETDPRPERRSLAVRTYCGIARTREALDRVYAMWNDETLAQRYRLSEGDLTGLAYSLALRFPERASEITARQRTRITNPDRLAQYDYIVPAVSPDAAVRDSVFQSLLVAENRRIEPWACSVLGLLNHPCRGEQAVAYIRPGLEEMGEVQRTGDIFFPRRWAAALLGSHRSEAAALAVDAFWKDHPDYPVLLGSKIRQQADPLYRLRKMRNMQRNGDDSSESK